jgi:EAL domain-containing protein (putative c-di-GMP-specific phosphodiesterase class I)
MSSPENNGLHLEISRAIERDEFVLYYQPQFNLITSKFEGVEALIRWEHPEKGLLLPEHFLSTIEESLFLIEIGRWIMRTACEQNKLWQDKGLQPIRVAVNVASSHLEQDNFVDDVLTILAEFDLHPGSLELEITENTILHNNVKSIENIHKLKKIGVNIALDDFGTGYSSISHLKKIPVDRIKIDKTFIENIHVNADDAAIVRAIISLATIMNLQVLAEGVETLNQLQMLIFHECKEAQGFYFSRPLSADDVEKFLLHHERNPFL